ncbi:ATP-binding protein [Thalassotalea profundi]|uniref:histidine kinase n=1 Tax=Thalassotalea profundi TaxID=2036687 RepID=A0ABQ3IFE5_9GAMM|nr:ATP-binding protein [Thalassotalea profundi]GHE81558.1 hypothetical protein GCM10011501_07240 [Thalassotalea profundi]
MAILKSKNNLVSSYHTSIIFVFFVLVVTAFILAGIKYLGELENYKKTQFQTLSKETVFLNNILSQSVNALSGMRDFANYYLDNPTELSATFPRLLQDNERFYLEKPSHDVIDYRQPLSVNITGIGQLATLSDHVKEELTMANALTPAFAAAEKANSDANWFYYVSFSKFISLYPWISRETWQYSARTIENPHIQRVKKAKEGNKELFWSFPYEDAAEKGLNTAVAAAVFRDQKAVGAVVIDISLGKIHEKLATIELFDHGLAIIDKNDNILVHKTIENKKIKGNVSKHKNLPQELTGLTYQALYNDNQGERVGHYFIQHKRVPVNDWVILSYQPYTDVVSNVTGRFITSLILSILALLALLALIYMVTRRTFIKPTQQFISHIAYSAKGDHGKVKPPKGWEHWFQLVENIFSQNRSLLQQLKDQNTLLDIRVNEKTQALLEKSNQHQRDYGILRSVMDAIPDYLIFNDLNHQVIGCNLAFEKFIGANESQIIGNRASDLLPKELSQLLNANPYNTVQDKGTLNVVETLENTYEVFIEKFYNSEKESLGTIIIIRDVTEQTAITSALEQAKIQAEKANLAKSQFLANMSHEIRTPINAIQGMHFLLMQSGLSSGQKIHIDNAQIASTALLHLVDELLDLAKIESGNMSIIKASCSIDRIIHQAVKLNIGIALHKGLQINVDIKSNVPQQVITDEMRLVQVLSNLLSNAVKFTHQGQINIIIENTVSEKNNALIKFTVKDTGIGIPKDKQHNLFEAFHQADESMTRQYGGSGLGLSICKHIVNLLDGDIKIVSNIDEGAEFCFVLPLAVDLSHTDRFQLDEHFVFVNFAVDLPECFPESIKANEHLYTCVEQLSEIPMLPECEQSSPLVIFLDSERITESAYKLITQLTFNNAINIDLFVLFQNSYQVQNNNALAWFDENNLPYVVCEQPLYRYCLLHIFDLLRDKNHTIALTPPDITSSVEVTANADKANLLGLTILLVEDNLVNQLVAKELLISMQAEVIIAENGQVALEILSTEQNISLILMDIQMPVMDGLTTAREIRKHSKYVNTPIITMTAHAREDDRKQSMEAGMNMHIAKPVKAEILLNSILSFF